MERLIFPAVVLVLQAFWWFSPGRRQITLKGYRLWTRLSQWALLISALVEFWFFGREPNWFVVVGLALMVSALLLKRHVIGLLGPILPSHPKHKNKEYPLVAFGAFAWVRHPLYLAILMFNLGIVVILSAWYSLMLWLVIVSLTLLRICNEEKRLFERSDYAVYAARTACLVPFIY